LRPTPSLITRGDRARGNSRPYSVCFNPRPS